MALKDLSPRAEPVTWAMLIGAALAAASSYGFNLTDELKDFILLIAPIVLTGIAARFAVFAPDTVEEIQEEAYAAGLPPTDPKPQMPSPPGGDTHETPREDWGIYNIDSDGSVVKEQTRVQE